MAGAPGISRSPSNETPHPASSSVARWGVLFLLASGVMISFVDRTSISSALADQGFVKQFNMSSVDRGWVNSAFFWSYGLVQIPMGWVVDRYGVKTPYAICFFLWCVATAATGFMTTFAALIVMRLLVGAAEAVVMPASFRWIGHHFGEGRSGTAVGIFSLGNKFGPAIGAPVAAWLIVSWDWRAMFIVIGMAGLVWLVPWLFLVENDLPSRKNVAIAKRTASTVSFRSIITRARGQSAIGGFPRRGKV